MSEKTLTITTWLASPLCSIAAISPDGLTYINRTGEPSDGIEAKYKDMATWLDNVPEGAAMKNDSSSLSYALRAPEVPGRVLTSILLYGPAEDAQVRFEAIQRVLEVVRQEVERRAEEAVRQEEDEQRVALAESKGDGEEDDTDADRDSE